MRVISGFTILFFLVFVTGCGGGGEAAKDIQGSDNTSTGTGDPATDPNPDPNPSPNPIPNPNPNPNGQSPGDLVASSDPDPNGSYPTLGQTVQNAPDPLVEPNSDDIVPVIGITGQPAPYIAGTSGTIQLGAADNNGGSGLKDIQCNIDGAGYNTCPTTIDLSNLSEGSHTVTAQAEDWDGNMSTEVSYTFYVDQTDPIVSIVAAPDAATTDMNANFQFQGSDIGSGISHYQCRVDTGSLTNCSNQEAFTNLPEGTRQVYVRAVDNVGNKSPTTTYSWVVDRSAPTIDVATQPNSLVYIDDPDPMVNFNVMDQYSPNGIVTTCALNGQAFACTPGTPFAIPTATPSSYSLVLTATDVVGNTTATTINWQSVNEAENRSTSISVGDVRPVDILFVVDNSGSMDAERANLGQRIAGMINIIDGLDWQIAVTSTDATSTDAKSDGQLIELIGMPGEYILDSNMNPAAAQSVFGNTIQNFGGGNGREEGIHSSRRVIDRYVAGQTNHTDFIRQGADLSIVVLSDEDESSDGSNVRTTPQQFVNYVDSTFSGQKNMVFHSIITIPGDTNCRNNGGAAYGNTYDALSRLTGFGEVGGAMIGSVCDQDYTSQLADIGQSVKDLQNSIRLGCAPFDMDNDGQPEVTVSYRADANAAYQEYLAPRTISNDRVVFSDLLPPGDYKADYKCKIN